MQPQEPATDATADPPAQPPVEEVARRIRALRAAGQLAQAAQLIDGLGPYGVADDDYDTSLGAAVLAAYGDQLRPTDRAGAAAAYRRAAGLQGAFAGGATSGGEGIARSEIAAEFDARARATQPTDQA